MPCFRNQSAIRVSITCFPEECPFPCPSMHCPSLNMAFLTGCPKQTYPLNMQLLQLTGAKTSIHGTIHFVTMDSRQIILVSVKGVVLTCLSGLQANVQIFSLHRKPRKGTAFTLQHLSTLKRICGCIVSKVPHICVQQLRRAITRAKLTNAFPQTISAKQKQIIIRSTYDLVWLLASIWLSVRRHCQFQHFQGTETHPSPSSSFVFSFD